MFNTIPLAPPDAILGLSEAFARDDDADKINLSVGVYKDENGKTPVLRCVKAAEQRLLEREDTKSYLGIDGLPDYRDATGQMLFGDTVESERYAVLQTPGGTGGVRVAADFVANLMRGSRIWVSNPTWANHKNIFAAAGVEVADYTYLDAARTGLDLDGMLADLANAAPRDVVLLHACCHNPTGVDPSPQQWQAIADILVQRQLLPLVDFAYQGFGAGLNEDAAGLRAILQSCEEAIVASSFSKNFGLYSERVGAVSVVAADADAKQSAHSQLKRLIRSNYSNPPRHGASIVATVLQDDALRQQWTDELSAMRSRIAEMRKQFVSGMQSRVPDQDFSFIKAQNGMFSFSGLNAMQVDKLRSQHSVYIVGSGRINVAGITPSNVDRLCDAIATVIT